MNKYNLDMIVEIPKDSNIKYEYDKELNMMRCDRKIATSMGYPGNYGYVPNTLSGDGDPLDILLICDYILYPGIVVNVKIVGVLFTEDEKGDDYKLIAVPSKLVDLRYININSYTELGTICLEKISHFFSHYKDNEKEKWVKVGEFFDKDVALDILNKCKISMI